MAKTTLSIMPYYGGKARMAHFITEHINYDDSDIFITPFGGACRVLLNKPPHKEEIYNDYGSGLCALMEILSSTESATDFIERLYKIECSEETFNWAKRIYDFAEVDLEQQARKAFRKLLIDNKVISSQKANLMLNILAKHSFATESIKVQKAKEIDTSVIIGFETLSIIRKTNTGFNIKYKTLLDNWKELYLLKEKDGTISRPRDMLKITDCNDLPDLSDMTLAIATYIVFTHSRDGMGKVWSGEKFKDTEHYKKYLLKLFKCAERLEGVNVYQIDAVEFFRRRLFVDVNEDIVNVPPHFRIMNRWINNPRVMMCCDPSYIDPDKEAEALKGIDINKEDSLSDAITRIGRKYPGDLGEDVYTKSFDYKAHENFLRCIQKAKCKILVCNYDLALYNKYLNEDTGWKRSEFVTSTSIGGKKNNLRVEVVWYNY